MYLLSAGSTKNERISVPHCALFFSFLFFLKCVLCSLIISLPFTWPFGPRKALLLLLLRSELFFY